MTAVSSLGVAGTICVPMTHAKKAPVPFALALPLLAQCGALLLPLEIGLAY